MNSQNGNPNAKNPLDLPKGTPERYEEEKRLHRLAKHEATVAYWEIRREQMGKPDAQKIADARKRRLRMREARRAKAVRA
jgi:hypothetical protein